MLLLLMLLLTLYHPYQTRTQPHPNLDANTTYVENISADSTLIPNQTNNQATINILICIHLGLRNNKYQNLGGYGQNPGTTNPKSKS